MDLIVSMTLEYLSLLKTHEKTQKLGEIKLAKSRNFEFRRERPVKKLARTID